MDKSLDKPQLKELEIRIDEVLYYFWDPIGVRDEPCARAEYSSYSGTVLRSVLSEDLNSITEILGKIEADSMGLSPNKDHNTKTAELLLRFKYAVEEGLK